MYDRRLQRSMKMRVFLYVFPRATHSCVRKGALRKRGSARSHGRRTARYDIIVCDSPKWALRVTYRFHSARSSSPSVLVLRSDFSILGVRSPALSIAVIAPSRVGGMPCRIALDRLPVALLALVTRCLSPAPPRPRLAVDPKC